nr:MAG: attachment glycoprotein [Wenzhou rodent jeilongvirus 2]
MDSTRDGKRDSYLERLGNYYGTPNNNGSVVMRKSKIGRDSSNVRKNPGGCVLDCCTWFLGFTISVITVTFVIIGIVKLGAIYQDLGTISARVLASTGEIVGLSGMLRDLINPRVGLINTMVSYTIPSLMNQMKQEIITEMQKKNNVVFEYKNNTCPKVPSPVHSPMFQEFNQDSLTRCQSRGLGVQLDGPIAIKEMPSFIPTQTTSRGCARIPTFSLSPYIWAYGHNVIRNGCADHGMSDQYFSIGVISESWGDTPHFETLTSWYMDDETNRKSCSVAAGVSGAWMGCTVVWQSFRDDYCSDGILPLHLSYMDIFGRKRYWTYDPRVLGFASRFAAFYFGVGSGVIVDGVVYLPFYAGLADNLTQSSFCHAPDCNNPQTSECDSAAQLVWLCSKVIVNGILYFNDDPIVRPVLRVAVINTRSNWLGAEMRLIHNYQLGITYIYTRSSGWHALPQVGLINLQNIAQVVWIDVTAIGRPGRDTCNAGSRCPATCLSGVYNDIFPLGRYYEFGATVYLQSDTDRVHPTIAFLNTTRVFESMTLTTAEQRAQYSTTTCFIFKGKPWCLSIVEMEPSVVGTTTPVPFTYTLPLVCASPLGSNLVNVGDDRDQIRAVVPSLTQAGGYVLSLEQLRLRWTEIRSGIPDVMYPSNYSPGSKDLFETDLLINPYAAPVLTETSVLNSQAHALVRPVSDPPRENAPLTSGAILTDSYGSPYDITGPTINEKLAEYLRLSLDSNDTADPQSENTSEIQMTATRSLILDNEADAEAMTRISELVKQLRKEMKNATSRGEIRKKIRKGIKQILFERSVKIVKANFDSQIRDPDFDSEGDNDVRRNEMMSIISSEFQVQPLRQQPEGSSLDVPSQKNVSITVEGVTVSAEHTPTVTLGTPTPQAITAQIPAPSVPNSTVTEVANTSDSEDGSGLGKADQSASTG